MTNARRSVAVIGCGYWGRNLVRNFSDLGGLGVICDTDERQLALLSATYKVRATNSFDDVLAAADVEAVVLAVPAAQHFALARRALLAGKDVFVEKPLALCVKEGQELLALATQRGRILMVGHLLQYHPAIIELKRLIEQVTFGKLRYITSSRLNWGKLRTEENILWSFAPHDISAILYLLNEEPSSVTAQAASYLNSHIADMTLTNLEFGSGVTAHIVVSWLHPFKEQKLVVVGEHKMAVFDDTASDNKLTLYEHQIDWINRVPIARKTDGEVIRLCQEEPLRAECQHFLECLSTRTRPRTDGENGVQVLRVLRACEQSIRSRGQACGISDRAPSYFAHPTAVVDEGAEIGENTKIWHFCHVMAGSSIGQGCILGQNVNVAGGVRIGNNVKIQNNVSIYNGVELQDDVFCGPSMVFTNVTNPRSHVNRKHEFVHTLVKKGATLGANSTIVCGCTVGAYGFVAAGAVVTHDVPDFALVMGVPAKQVGWVCECGIRLRDDSNTAECPACLARYCIAENGLERLASYARTA